MDNDKVFDTWQFQYWIYPFDLYGYWITIIESAQIIGFDVLKRVSEMSVTDKIN